MKSSPVKQVNVLKDNAYANSINGGGGGGVTHRNKKLC